MIWLLVFHILFHAFAHARFLLLIPRRGYYVMTGVKAHMKPDSEKEKHAVWLPRSPSASNARLTQVSQQPPSTLPSQNTHLPSSVMNTPSVNISLFNGALNTPGTEFNFADFVNVAPSPAQPPWGGRTPGMPRTLAAARAARRGLKTSTSQGLALELS